MKNVKYVFSLIVLFLCQEAVQQAVRYFPCYKLSTNDGYSYYHNLQICPKTFICFSWNDTTLYAVVKNFVNKWSMWSSSWNVSRDSCRNTSFYYFFLFLQNPFFFFFIYSFINLFIYLFICIWQKIYAKNTRLAFITLILRLKESSLKIIYTL